MPPTTLKLSEALKRRVAAAAEVAGKSPHAFMLDAIERQTRLDEERRVFVSDAVAAREDAVRSGEGYAMSEVHRYISGKVRGKKAKVPKARAWRK